MNINKKLSDKYNYKPLILALSVMLILALSIKTLKNFGFGLTYQVSASMPKGLYLIIPAKKIQRGDIVIFRAPQKFTRFLLAKHWLPQSGLLMKYVVGISKDKVCTKNRTLWLNNHAIARIYDFYAPKKQLPRKFFCGKLKVEQYLLLSTITPHSFDSRYFGPIAKQRIVGKAIKL